MDIRKQIEAYVPYNEQEEVDKKAILQCMETCEDVLTRENLIAHFTASCWIVNKERTKVLMIYHNIMDSWAWTGGHADGEDNLLAVALREAQEETGLTKIRPVSEEFYSIEVLPVFSHIKRGAFVNAHVHLNVSYLLEADEAEPIRVKEDENSAIRWVDLEQAPRLAKEEEDRILYQKLNDKLNGYLSQKKQC